MKNEKLIANTFNNYLADITKTLKLKKHSNFDGQSLFGITGYFKNNKSVMKIIEENWRELIFIYFVFKRGRS